MFACKEGTARFLHLIDSMWKLPLGTWLFVVVVSHSYSQILPYKTYTTREGLPSNIITDLYQDSLGQLWIGTNNGLSVFNGSKFTNYSSVDGLTNDYINCIVESKKTPGAMWIGTNTGGVSYMLDGKFTSYRFGKLDDANNVSSIVEDSGGTVWCGTNAGVFQIMDGYVSPFEASQGSRLTNAFVVSGREGSVVIAADSVLCVRFRDGNFAITSLTHLTRGMIQDVLPQTDGSVWIECADSVILHTLDNRILGHRKLASHLFALADDNEESLLLGTNTGYLRLPKSAWEEAVPQTFSRTSGLPSVDIGPMLADRANNLWIGTREGLVKLAERHQYTFPAASYYFSAAQDTLGHLWVTSGNGLEEIYRDLYGIWHQVPHHEAGSETQRTRVSIDASNRLWILVDGNPTISACSITPTVEGRSRLTTVAKLLVPPPSKDIEMFSFLIDREERLWCMYDHFGLTTYNIRTGAKIRTYSIRDGLPDQTARAMLQDRDGKIWIGYFFTGLAKITLSKDSISSIRTYSVADGLPNDGVRSIIQDRSGRIWVGTRHGGIAVLENNEFRTVSMKEGLLSNAVWSIAQNLSDTLWLATDAGVEGIDIRFVRPLRVRSELLGEKVVSCGIFKTDFLWYLGERSLTVYEFGKVRPDTLSPPIKISRFVVSGTPRDISAAHEYAYDENTFMIEYLAISLKDERDIFYRYRLKGLDTAWSQPTTQRAVTYGSLSVGTYSFEVVAINADQAVSRYPASATFMILPAVWARWWFRTGAIGAAIFILALAYRYRVRRLLELERLRSRIAGDLHDDVASTLSSIVIYSESLKRRIGTEQELHFLIQKISSLSRDAQEAIGNLVWSTSPHHDTLKDMLERIRNITAGDCSAAGIAYHLNIDEDARGNTLTPEARKNIYLIFKEALSNTIKHGNPRFITVRAGLKGNIFTMSVIDDGIGFKLPEAERPDVVRGHGLLNMERRAKEINGKLIIISSPGKGTTVEFSKEMT